VNFPASHYSSVARYSWVLVAFTTSLWRGDVVWMMDAALASQSWRRNGSFARRGVPKLRAFALQFGNEGFNNALLFGYKGFNNALLFGYEGFKIGDLRSIRVGGSGNPPTGKDMRRSFRTWGGGCIFPRVAPWAGMRTPLWGWGRHWRRGGLVAFGGWRLLGGG